MRRRKQARLLQQKTFVAVILPIVSKRPILLVPVILLLLAVSFLDPITPASEPIPYTVAYISDGDTMTIYDEAQNKLRIRFAGIDAPESDQPGGLESKAHLMELLPKGTGIQLDEQTKDRYGRTVAIVWRDGTDINLEQIRSGHAWVYRQYNDSPQYLEAEQEARLSNEGLWNDRATIAPWEWRKRKRDKRKQ